jgi:hypothetical protein
MREIFMVQMERIKPSHIEKKNYVQRTKGEGGDGREDGRRGAKEIN